MVTSSESAEGGGQTALFSDSYTKTFYEVFPYYLLVGMTPEQYWDGDPSLTRYYRKADEMRQKRENEHMWLQGMYIYEALCDVSPILHAFAKRGVKPVPYPSRPYSLTNKERDEERKLAEKKARDKAKRYMESMMAKTNKRFESK